MAAATKIQAAVRGMRTRREYPPHLVVHRKPPQVCKYTMQHDPANPPIEFVLWIII